MIMFHSFQQRTAKQFLPQPLEPRGLSDTCYYLNKGLPNADYIDFSFIPRPLYHSSSLNLRVIIARARVYHCRASNFPTWLSRGLLLPRF